MNKENSLTETEEYRLAPQLNSHLRSLCGKGYSALDGGDTKKAIRLFYSSWNLLPKPQTRWEEAGWVLTALGDAYYSKKEYKQAKEALMSALHCPRALGNPTIHFKLGQCLYALGSIAAARTQFLIVVQQGGSALFKNHNTYRALLGESLET